MVPNKSCIFAIKLFNCNKFGTYNLDFKSGGQSNNFKGKLSKNKKNNPGVRHFSRS